MELPGKVAVVTGAGAGIGQAIARRLAREGAAIVVADIREADARAVAERIVSVGGQATAVRADVSAENDVANVIAAAERVFGGLDILVNNAGGVDAPYFPDGEPAQWRRAIAVNLGGVMLGIHFAVRAMQTRGGGVVINISSMGGVGFQPYDKPEYGAAKAGVMRLTASLGSLSESMGIRVNCICPGWVDTPASRQSRANMTPEELASVPPVLLLPEEIAEAVVMFVRDETLAGRVMLWPEGAPWQIVPLNAPY